MKVALVVPFRPMDQVLQILPPMGLGYLSRALRDHGHQVEIWDLIKDRGDTVQFLSRVEAAKPDVVGFSLFTPDVGTVQEMSGALKERFPSVIACGGGPHPSGDPADALRMMPELDFVFKGEAEFGFPALVDLLQAGALTEEKKREIPGLAYRSGADGKVQCNEPLFVEDLDLCGYTDWDLINPLDYQKYPPTLFVKQRPFAPIIITRGCPFRCTYCSGHNVTGRKMRTRSIDHAVREIRELHDRFGVREFHIEDDNFIWNKKYVQVFCQRLLDEKLKISWTMPNGVRLDTLDETTLGLMKKAGCYILIVGIESGSERILRIMRKALSIKTIEEKVALAHKAGLLVHGFFMLGYPEETREDIEETLNLALRLKLTGANFHSFQPLPGTEISQQLFERGDIQGFNYDSRKASFANPVYAPRDISVEDLKKMQKRMIRSFYLRPHIILRYAKEVIACGNIVPFIRKAFTYMR